ncbi:BolA/IbaG family iron-sulfur metabolism protein [archaeon]|nr:MAG: BolA/IbaG family iron-sulfur metabolism protein [archaeon]
MSSTAPVTSDSLAAALEACVTGAGSTVELCQVEYTPVRATSTCEGGIGGSTEGASTVGGTLILHLVTPFFDGMPLLARHREVTAWVQKCAPGLHAMTLKLFTPAQWAAKQAPAAATSAV